MEAERIPENDAALNAALDAATLITVGGRQFRACRDTTFEQDIYINSLQRAAGIGNLDAEFKKEQGLSDLTQAVISHAFDTGQLFPLLGAAFEEVGLDWSMSEAKANAQFFARLKSREDKAALRSSVVAVILSFFVKGLLSSASSEKNSSTSESRQPSHMPAQQDAYDANGVVVVPRRSPSGNQSDPVTARDTSSDSGIPLSENSLDTTPTDTPPS